MSKLKLESVVFSSHTFFFVSLSHVPGLAAGRKSLYCRLLCNPLYYLWFFIKAKQSRKWKGSERGGANGKCFYELINIFPTTANNTTAEKYRRRKKLYWDSSKREENSFKFAFFASPFFFLPSLRLSSSGWLQARGWQWHIKVSRVLRRKKGKWQQYKIRK